MPLYEYHCTDCDESFEKIVSFSEASRIPACPKCQSQHTERKLSKIAALFGANSKTASAGSSCGSSGSRFS